MFSKYWGYALFLLLGSLLIRPSHFGEDYSIFGSLIIMTTGIISSYRNKTDISYSVNLKAITVSTCALWLFLCVHSVSQSTNNFFALYAFVLISSSTIGAALSFSCKPVHDAYFRIFRLYLCAMCVSELITIFLSTYIPLESLLVARLPTKTYTDFGDFYFPFTASYDVKDYGWIQIPRLSAGFRESGIAQAFYASAIATLPSVSRTRDRVTFFLLVVGGLLTQSTIGFALVTISAYLRLIRIYEYSIWKQILSFVFLLPILGYGVYFSISDETLGLGLASKQDTDSALDRLFGTQAGISRFFENPFGYGIYNSAYPQEGINLLSSLGMIGIFGIAAVLINLFISIKFSLSRREKIEVLMPLFVTSIFSQPFIDAGLVYIFYLYTAPNILLRRNPVEKKLKREGRPNPVTNVIEGVG